MSFKDKLKDKHSIFSMIIGRRRVGKIALLLQPFEVDKKNGYLWSKTKIARCNNIDKKLILKENLKNL